MECRERLFRLCPEDFHEEVDDETNRKNRVGLTHNWSSAVSSGLYYGWVKNDFEDAAKATYPDLSESLQSIHANVWWSPAPKVRVGAEIMKGWRETNGGGEGDATRFQLGLVYSF